MNKTISIILPTYNEAASIIRIITRVHNVLEGYEHEIIIVDDNSPDGTYDVVERENRSYCRLFKRREERGLASALRFGLQHATGAFIVFMDSDGNHDPMYLPAMLAMLKDVDCAVASRFVPGGGMRSPLRHVCSLLFNAWVRAVLKLRVKDALYGYLACKRELFDECPHEKVFVGFGDYCMRLLYYFQKKGFKIIEIPARNAYRYGGKSKANYVKELCNYLRATVRLKRESL